MLRRILLYIGLTLVVMLTFIMFATRTVLSEGFSELETGFLRGNVARVQNAVSDELAELGRTTQDWAAWDETYTFVHNLNSTYIRDNLANDTFTNLRLNAMVYLDPRGRPIFGRAYYPAAASQSAPPPALLDWLSRHPRMVVFDRTDAHAEAVAVVPGGAYLMAARPILDSALRGPIRGTLVFARFFNADEARRLSMSLRLSVTFYASGDPSLPPEAARALAGLSPQTELFIDSRREDLISGYALLRGSESEPLLLRVEFPRDIHRQGEATARYFIMWLIAIGVIFSGVVLLVLQGTVLSRLQQLSAGVLAIGTGGGSAARVPVRGRDQIAYLGAAINGMLDALEGSTSLLHKSEQRNEAFLDAIPDLILRVSATGTIVDVRLPPNLRAEADRWRAAVGRNAFEVVAELPVIIPANVVSQGLEAVTRALETGVPQLFDFTARAEEGTRHFQARIASSGGEETVVLVRDITALKIAEEAQRRDILVKEIHHRVKNNLQVISSLLALQASSAEDERTRLLLDESRDRVRSMALVHEKLYGTGAGPGAGYAEYVHDLVEQLQRSYGVSSNAVAMRIDIDDIPMDMDQSVPLGLIVNELVSNALSHAFPDGRHGSITVSLKRVDAATLTLTVSDDGVGLPAGVNCQNPTTLGLRIVNILARQLRATLVVESGAGTVFSLAFPAA